MKKLMSILLVLLMLTSVLASCGGNDETTTTEAPTTEAPTTEAPTTEAPTTEAPTTEAPTTEAPTTEAPTTEAPTTETPTTETPIPTWSSKDDIRTKWSGRSLTIACSTGPSASITYPWCVIEPCVETYKDQGGSGLGVLIDEAVLERNDFIKNTYGVSPQWLCVTKSDMHNAIELATLAGNIQYDIALPLTISAQTLVASGDVYDLANRELIDFNNSYYSKEALKAYTAKGHTFFVTGGFSIVDYDTAFMIYFNKSMLGDGSEQAANDLYKLVKDGKWTYAKLIEYASAVYSDDGDGKADNEDTYGLYMSSFDDYFNHFGVNKVAVNQTTGEWELTINDEKADDIVDVIRTTVNAKWRTGQYWDGSALPRINDNKLLFMYAGAMDMQYVTVDFGVVPFPMLNEEQGRYYSNVHGTLPALMCIPKIAQEREMSEYFVDVLSWTGEEYVQKAYLQTKKEQLKTDADREMFTEYVLKSLTYDPSYSAGAKNIISLSLAWNSEDYDFEKAYNEKSPDALKIIAEWNKAWGSYTEE